MRRPLLCVRSRLTALAALAIVLLITSTSQGQESSGDSSSLARYVPKDDVILYLEYEGLDAHADAWQKTAAYKILNNTPTGVMLEELAAQGLDRLLALGPINGPGLKGSEAVLLIKHLARSGFLAAWVANRVDTTKPHDGIIVLRNAFKDKTIRAIVARVLQNSNAPNTRPQQVVRAGHKIVSVVRKNGSSFAWWVEESKKEDVVLVLPRPDAADVFLETLDAKRPNATGIPRRIELAKLENGFQPTGLMFVDPRLLQSMKLPESLGLSDVKKVDFRWGFQDDALMSITRITAPGPRKGLLALLDGPSFDKAKLTPIPESVGGFTIVSLDLKSTMEKLVALAKTFSPAVEDHVNQVLESVKTKTKLRLKEDILSHLGPKVAWYILPAKASTASPAGTNMISMMMASAGLDQIPKLAIVADIDNPVAFGKVLDEVMAATNRELKAQASAQASKAMGDTPETKGAGSRNRGPNAPSMEFRLMSGESKMYVMSVPSELSSQFPASLRPTIRVGPKHVVFAVSADVARLVLESKGGWSPPSELSSAFQGLPSKLKMLNLVDTRDTLPGILAALPGKIQSGINTAILMMAGAANPPPGQPGTSSVPGAGGQPGAPMRPSAPNLGQGGSGSAPTPGVQGGSGGSGGLSMPPGMQPPGSSKPAGGLTTLSFQIDASKLPSADAIKSLLFPSIYTVEANDEEIKITSREAFLNIGDPSKMGAMSSVMPMLQSMMGMPPGMSLPPGVAPPGASPPPGSAPPGSPPPTAPGGRRPGMRPGVN